MGPHLTLDVAEAHGIAPEQEDRAPNGPGPFGRGIEPDGAAGPDHCRIEQFGVEIHPGQYRAGPSQAGAVLDGFLDQGVGVRPPFEQRHFGQSKFRARVSRIAAQRLGERGLGVGRAVLPEQKLAQPEVGLDQA